MGHTPLHCLVRRVLTPKSRDGLNKSEKLLVLLDPAPSHPGVVAGAAWMYSNTSTWRIDVGIRCAIAIRSAFEQTKETHRRRIVFRPQLPHRTHRAEQAVGGLGVLGNHRYEIGLATSDAGSADAAPDAAKPPSTRPDHICRPAGDAWTSPPMR